MFQANLYEPLQVSNSRVSYSCLPLLDRSLRHAHRSCYLDLGQADFLTQCQCQQTKTVIFELVSTMIAHTLCAPNGNLFQKARIRRPESTRIKKPKRILVISLQFFSTLLK